MRVRGPYQPHLNTGNNRAFMVDGTTLENWHEVPYGFSLAQSVAYYLSHTVPPNQETQQVVQPPKSLNIRFKAPPLLPERQWSLQSSSNSEKLYLVKLFTGKRWTCTCPQFVFRGTECKHIYAVKHKIKE